MAENHPGGPLPWAAVARVKDLLRPIYRRTSMSRIARLEAELAHTRHLVAEMHRVLMELNHEIRSGGDAALPLFLGASQRLRLDADTAIAATEVMERQLADLDARIDELRSLATDRDASR